MSSSRAVVHICVVLHAIASPDDRCHRGKPASMRHDGSLCDVDQHILALIVCGFGWHTRVVCDVGRVDSCIYFGIAAVSYPQSGTFFQYTLAAHVTSNHETCHVQSEWEETLCLDQTAS